MKLLVIEDDVVAAGILKKVVEVSIYDVEVELAMALKKGLELMVTYKPDVVVLDADLPDSQAYETLNAIPYFFPSCVIVTSAFDDEALVTKTFACGGTDFILKGSGLDVVRSIRFAYLRNLYGKRGY